MLTSTSQPKESKLDPIFPGLFKSQSGNIWLFYDKSEIGFLVRDVFNTKQSCLGLGISYNQAEFAPWHGSVTITNE